MNNWYRIMLDVVEHSELPLLMALKKEMNVHDVKAWAKGDLQRTELATRLLDRITQLSEKEQIS